MSQPNEPTNDDDVRIYIVVERRSKGAAVNRTVRQLDYWLWRQGKLNTAMLDIEVNAMIREVSYGRPDTPTSGS